jgi:hypothetical protein
MRLLHKLVYCPNHVYRIEFYDTEARRFNAELWTAPITATAEAEFCEYLRGAYVVFTDTLHQMSEGGSRFSAQFDTWWAARAAHTRNWYGWITVQEGIDRYPARNTTTQPRRSAMFSTVYGNRHSSAILDEAHNFGFNYTVNARTTKHHHFCDKCQKTRKCGVCDTATKVRKICESCEMTETICTLQSVTIETPNIPPQQYRVSLDIESTSWGTSGFDSALGVRFHSGNNDPQT